ncbi:MAG TPA: gamma carbonic anhydrase family protein [Stellaceae bacterium]|jgi:carbonic anhydrase/acetyltransferase-like protein (isoleucine patch superfamily)|nr:gamma carbonic anhydrase family protein [Stellaceae bacterium]
MSGPVILPYREILPRIHPTAFIAPGVVVIGDVEIGAHANIWFNVVIRGDDAPIRIGAGANIQDGTIVHVTYDIGVAGGEHIPCLIGEGVAVGHLALLHGCTIEPGGFVGMKACVMDRAIVESGAMVAAGAVVTPRKIVKAGDLWAGTPARFSRALKPEEVEYMKWVPAHYRRLAAEYQRQASPPV